MKQKTLRYLTLAGTLVFTATMSKGATGTWNYNSTAAANLGWGSATSWTGSVPNAVGDIADFSVLNITAARSITLNGDRTVGTLNIGDSASTYSAYTFNGGTPTTSRLIMDQTGSANALIVVATTATAASTAANIINAGISLQDNLVIDTNQTSATATALSMTGVIDDGAGSYSVTKNGPSIISMSGTNTYDGGTTITAGRVNAANASSFGTGMVTISGTGQAYLSAATIYANAFSLTGNGFTETSGNLGALRLQGSTVSGAVSIAGDARIGAFNGSNGTLTGALSGSAALEINGSAASFNGTINLNGSASGYTGALTVSQGRLNLADASNPGGSLTVKDGASVGGETTIAGAITLGNPGSTTTGATLYINPETSGALHTNGNLTLNGKTTVSVAGAVTGSSVSVMTYTGTLVGSASNLDLLGGLSAYRAGTGFDFSVANQINLTFVTGDIKWSGATSSAWNATDSNWKDGASPTTFFNLDAVTFDDSSASNAVYTTNLANATNNDLVFTAVATGAAGESVSVSFQDPFVADSPLSVNVSGSSITVSLGTDALGLINSTASAVKAAIEANTSASALVTVANSAANDGSGIVAGVFGNLSLANPAITIATGITVSPGDMTFDHSAIDYSLSGAGVIGGGGNIVKNGTGTLSISNANTFTGGATLNQGKLRLGSNTALGSGVITLAGGQFSSDSTVARTIANSFALNGTVILSDATDNGAITMNGAGALTGNVVVSIPTAATVNHYFAGSISDGSGSFSLTKQGVGTLTLGAANSYDGGTSIVAGKISAGTATAFGTGSVSVSDGAQASLVAAGPFTNAFSIAGNGVAETAGTSGAIRLLGATVSGPITMVGDSKISAYGNTTGTLSGAIGESGADYLLQLVNDSTTSGSTITVSGNNTYSGGTSIKGTVVKANHNNALGTGPVTIESNGTATVVTRLELGTNVEINNDITINSTAQTDFRAVVHSYAGNLATPSVAVVNGDIMIQALAGNGGHLASESLSASVLRVMGAINVTPGISPVIRVGTVELGGGGDYLTLNHGEGTLKLAANNGINPDATLRLATSETSTFDLNGKNQTLVGLVKGTTDAAKVATVLNNHASVASTLTLDVASSATYAGLFGAGASALNVVKTGAGTLTLPGSSSAFPDQLSVTQGGLNLTGSLGTSASSATFGSGTSLSGEGVFGGNLTLAGTTLQVDGTTAPAVFATGTATVTGGVTVNLLSLPAVAGPISVMKFGSLVGNAANFTLANASTYRSPTFAVASNEVTLTLGAAADLTWTGTGGSDWDIGTTTNWNNSAPSPSSFYNGDNVTFGNSGGGTIGVAANVGAGNLVIDSNDNWLFQGSGIVAASSVTKSGTGTATFETPVNFPGPISLGAGVLKLSPSTATTLAGTITGAGTLAKAGSGALTISSANTAYTGAVVIANGELVPAHSNALGTAAKITFGDASTLPTDISTLSLNTGVTLAAPQIQVSATAIDARISGIGGAMSDAAITKRGTGKLTIGHPTDYTQTAAYLTGNSSIVIEKGTVGFSSRTPVATTTAITLGNSNSLTDATVLEIPAANANDQLTLTAAVTLGTGATNSRAVIAYTGVGSMGAPAMEGTVNLNGRDLYLENSSQLSAAARINNIKSVISGTGNVRVRGGLNLDGTINAGARSRLMAMTPGTTTPTPNLWVGDLYLETGMLQIGNGSITTAFNAIPNGSVVYMSAGTIMGFGSSGDTFRGLSGGAAAGPLPAAIMSDNTSGGGTISITLTSGDAADDYVYGGNISSGTRTMNITKSGSGSQTFNGDRAGLGTLVVSGGTMVVNGSRTGDAAASSTTTTTVSGTNAVLAVGKDDALGIGTVNLNSATGTIRSADTNARTLANPITYSFNFTLGSATTGNLLFTGNVNVGGGAKQFTVLNSVTEFSGVITGSGALDRTKSGTGTLIFSGDNTYTGNTVVNQGTLLVNNTSGSGTGTTNVTVAAGAVVGGSGTISGSVTTAAAAIIAPGNSTGVLTIGSGNLSAGGILQGQIDDTSTPKCDKLVTTGNLNVTGATLDLSISGTANEPFYILASYDSLTGTFATVTGKPSNYVVVYDYNDGVSTKNIALVKQTDTYLGWLASYPTMTGANQAPDVDFDNDGLDNGVEFVIGADPTAFTNPSTAGYPKAVVSGSNLVFTFKRVDASHGFTVAAQTSTGLVTWPNSYTIPTAASAVAPVTVVENGTAPDDVTVTIPMAPDQKKFVRLQAEIPFTP